MTDYSQGSPESIESDDQQPQVKPIVKPEFKLSKEDRET